MSPAKRRRGGKRSNPYDEDLALMQEVVHDDGLERLEDLRGSAAALPSAMRQVLGLIAKTFAGESFSREQLAREVAGQTHGARGQRLSYASGAIEASKAVRVFERRGLLVSLGGRPERYTLTERGEQLALGARLAEATDLANSTLESEIARLEAGPAIDRAALARRSAAVRGLSRVGREGTRAKKIRDRAKSRHAARAKARARAARKPRSRTVVAPHAATKAHSSHAIDAPRFRETLVGVRLEENPACTSKQCARGEHHYDETTRRCIRKGCTAQLDEPGTRFLFGFSPEIEAETRRREAATGQRELFRGDVRENPMSSKKKSKAKKPAPKRAKRTTKSSRKKSRRVVTKTRRVIERTVISNPASMLATLAFNPIDDVPVRVKGIRTLLRALGFNAAAKDANKKNYKRYAAWIVRELKSRMTRIDPVSRKTSIDAHWKKAYDNTVDAFRRMGLLESNPTRKGKKTKAKSRKTRKTRKASRKAKKNKKARSSAKKPKGRKKRMRSGGALIRFLAKKRPGFHCLWGELPASVRKADKVARRSALKWGRDNGVPLDEVPVRRSKVAGYWRTCGRSRAVEYEVEEGKRAGRAFRHLAGDHGRGRKRSTPAVYAENEQTGLHAHVPVEGTNLKLGRRGITG